MTSAMAAQPHLKQSSEWQHQPEVVSIGTTPMYTLRPEKVIVDATGKIKEAKLKAKIQAAV